MSKLQHLFFTPNGAFEPLAVFFPQRILFLTDRYSTLILSYMLMIIRSKINSEPLKQVAEDLKGYVKVVVDIQRKILSAGGEKHVDGEQLLLKDGSRQDDLWGAGLDLETNEMDFDSMINLRPAQNTSREILDQKIRQQVELITRLLLQGK